MLGEPCCEYTRDVEESKALNFRKEPCTIISASGMCEAGRIRHHLKNNIEDAKNTILIPGFQAAHTLGRRLIEGAKEINLFHETYQIRAAIEQIHGFSAHADQADLMRMLEPLSGKTKQAYLVHGESDESAALAEQMRECGFSKVEIAQPGLRVSF